jgi:hypothetical protein
MMKKLMQVGFFKELPHGDSNGASLIESQNQVINDSAKSIGGYLDSGVLLVAAPGLARDVLSNNKEIIGPLGRF